MIPIRRKHWFSRANAPATSARCIMSACDDGWSRVVANHRKRWNAKYAIRRMKSNEPTSELPPLNVQSIVLYWICQFLSYFFSRIVLLCSNRLYWEKGFTINHWAKTIILVSTMCITGAFAWVIIKVYVDPIIRVLTAGIAILIGYICVKLLGENTLTAYRRAKVSSINIVTSDTSTVKLNTICQDVTCIWIWTRFGQPRKKMQKKKQNRLKVIGYEGAVGVDLSDNWSIIAIRCVKFNLYHRLVVSLWNSCHR